MERLAELLGPLGSTVLVAFQLMEVAEAIIAEEQEGKPGEVRERIDRAFGIAVPTDPIRGREVLYREHVRELCGRLERGEDTRPATDAEILGFLAESSLRVQLNWVPGALYSRLFERLFPGKAAELDLDVFAVGEFEEPVANLEEDLRKRLAVDSRTAAPRAETGEG